jgi:hypothetical protein
VAKQYATPLHRRIKQADALRGRYRSDPAYRLHKVNSVRVRKGLPLATDEAEIDTDRARRAADLQRGARGRWLA